MDPEDLERRLHLFRLIAGLGVVVCFTFAALWLFSGSPLAAAGSASAGLTFVGFVALLRRRRPRYLGVSVLCVAMLFGVTLSNWRFGGFDAPTLVWLPFPLVLSVLLGSRRDQAVTAVASAATFVVLWALPPVQDVPASVLAWMRVANVVGVTVTGVLLAVSAESARRASTARLETANTAIAAARDAADAANRAKSETMANVSHELRTPLHAIVGMADLLLKSPLDEAQREQAQTASEAARSLSSLLADLLDASKLEAGALAIVPAPTDVAQVIRGAADLLRPRVQARALTLTVDLPNERELVLCDAARVRQIAVNLIDNAIKFTERGTISVRLRQSPEPTTNAAAPTAVRLALSVEDTGIGIAPDKMGAVFERFRQLDGSSTRRQGGTGLGLSTARELALLMGGTLEVASTPGVGSTFTFSVAFPVARCGAAEVLVGRRVLLADDNIVNQRVAALMLQSFGCEVDVVADGSEAVKLAGERRYDVVLLDCHMPEMDGYRAAVLIRERAQRAPPILALTAASTDELERAHAAGMMDVLRKPIDADSMRAALERALVA